MLDDFFVRALLAGMGVALVAGPMGCFVVWRKMAYFGDTLAHSALLGVSLGVVLNVSLMAGIFVVAVVLALCLTLLERRETLPLDTVLGILSHATLAAGLILLSLMTWVRMDLRALLLGDIVAVSKTDLLTILVGGGVILSLLAYLWRPLLAVSISSEIAAAEGQSPDRMRLFFVLLMAATVAIAMKIVGVLMIAALLIIPPAAARPFSSTPLQMAVLAAVIGVASVVAGLFASSEWDTPAGPSIVIAAVIAFVASLLPLKRSMG